MDEKKAFTISNSGPIGIDAGAPGGDVPVYSVISSGRILHEAYDLPPAVLKKMSEKMQQGMDMKDPEFRSLLDTYRT